MNELNKTKQKLRYAFVKYDLEELSQMNDKSTIEKIKCVAAVGLEASKITNIIENFISTYRMTLSKDNVDLLNKHRGSYSIIDEFMGDNIQIIYIMDFMLSLVTSYQTGVILYNTLRKYCDSIILNNQRKKSTVNIIGYHDFAKKIVHCLALYTKYRGETVGIKNILVDESYSLDADVLEKQLRIEQIIANFDKYSNADTHEILKLYDGLEFKLNYFYCINNFCENARKLLNTNESISCDQLLQNDYYHIVGNLIFQQKKPPQEFETLMKAMHFNLYHIIVENCVEAIHVNKPINSSSLDNLNINVFNSNFEIISLERRNYYNLTSEIHRYIHNHNKVVSFLLEKIFYYLKLNDESDRELPFPLNNYLKLESVEIISKIFSDNKMLAALNYDEILFDKISKLLLDPNLSFRAKYNVLSNIKEIQLKKFFNICYETIIEKIIESDELSFEDRILFSQIKDLNKRAKILLKYIDRIECYELVEYVINGIINGDLADQLEAVILNQLCDTLKHMKIYQNIGNALNLSWRRIVDMSREEPDVLLENLLSQNLYELGMAWSEIHSLSSVKDKLSNFMVHFAVDLRKLSKNNFIGDTHVIFNIIEKLPTDIVLRFYKKIILQLKNIYLIEYILNFLVKHESADTGEIRGYQMSLIIFKNISPLDVKELWLLFSRPLLIIEQFIMNSKFDILQKIISAIRPLLFTDRICKSCSTNRNKFRADYSINYYSDVSEDYILMNIDYNHNESEITEECIDSLLRIYAAKSLDIRVIENHTIGEFHCGSNEHLSVDSLYGIFVIPKTPPKREDWIRDEDATQCMCCHRSVFTMLTRRHHCRRCGRVVCHSCSTSRMKIDNMYDDIPVRFCTDCARQTEQMNNKRQNNVNDDKNSVESFDDWILCGSIKRDNIIRDEFCYEYAPSVPLCLSILSHHSLSSEYSYFLLYHCKKFENLLRPIQPGYPNPEIDYLLVTRILHCLALAAKVRDGPPECNTIIDHADIILSIVQHGCESLLPMEPLNINSLRKLRDNLVHAEKWDIALDLSFKCGYSSTGVLAAWGISCLRFGCYEIAREKLSHCLNQIVSIDVTRKIMLLIESTEIETEDEVSKIRRPTKSPPLLSEIINVLESTHSPTSATVFERAKLIKNSTSSLSSSKSIIKSALASHEPALNILNILDNLNNITLGKYDSEINSNKSKDKKSLSHQKILSSSHTFEECMYYLITYGSDSDILTFLVKYNQLEQALRYTILQNIDPELFVKKIYLPNLESGNVESVLSAISKMNEYSKYWNTYIIHVCRFLETKSMLNCLYHLQILLKDPIRASMTCVKFYSKSITSFTELKLNTHHLKNAQNHLQSELELCHLETINSQQQRHDIGSSLKTNTDASNIVMKMDSKSLNNHINTIVRQIDVTKFLANCEEDQSRHPVKTLKSIFGSITTIPTLFGTLQEKIQLCVIILICGKNIEEGFGLVYR